MEILSKTELAKVIAVDDTKCINCHACIAACPVKYCNDGSGDTVQVNSNMCIACGKCISACTHGARNYIDDFNAFQTDIKNGEKIIAIVAPSIVASFPKTYKNINGWLKSLGVNFIFDVSFGAELTVKSYAEHLKIHSSKTIIAQPCPSVVTYIQLFRPELLEYLAPAHSPMVHSIKMIKEFYPQYKEHKLAVISPCMAKKREFEETGEGDYLIAFKSIEDYFLHSKKKIEDFPETEFDGPAAERAVRFSSPGGLLKTAERLIPDIAEKTRKIEGADLLYPYLDKLPEVIQNKMAPLLIDCLNCENGCNAGPVSLAKDKSIDEIEYFVNLRSAENKKHYSRINGASDGLNNTVNSYWKEDLYRRVYQNLQSNVELKYPNEEELTRIYKSMHKYSESDLFNCVSCGYNSCEKMAVAIYNGLNKPENCHHYLQGEKDNSQSQTQKSEQRLNNILESAHDGFVQVDKNFIIEHANQALKTMLKRDDLIGRSFFEFLDADNIRIIYEQRKLRENNKKSAYELTITQSDGNKLIGLVSGSPLYDEHNKLVSTYAMISDITELKNAEQALRTSHLKLEEKVSERTEELNTMINELQYSTELIQSANKELEKLSIVASEIDNATIIMDKEGYFEWVNQGFIKLFEVDAAQVIGKNIINSTTPEYIKDEIEKCIHEVIPINYEFELTKPDSKPRWIQVTLTPILDGNNEIKKLIAIDTDITALKEKEFEILSQKEEIEAQRDSIEKQRDFARRQSSEIKSSITYASRIQTALLSDRKLFDKNFRENFIMFAPKYGVSGDFYWISERNNKVYVAVVDCTGHGVPGAFMSMLGISYLNEIVNRNSVDLENLNANQILGQLRTNIITALNHSGDNIEPRDGMDISLCIFDFEENTMQFSAAIQSIFIIRDGDLQEIKGDRMPVGMYEDNQKPFTNHVVHIKKDDQFYLYTDGIVDQFNSDNINKLKKVRLKEILLTYEQQSMRQQFSSIQQTFKIWRGDSKQVDDMLLVGLKV